MRTVTRALKEALNELGLENGWEISFPDPDVEDDGSLVYAIGISEPSDDAGSESEQPPRKPRTPKPQASSDSEPPRKPRTPKPAPESESDRKPRTPKPQENSDSGENARVKGFGTRWHREVGDYKGLDSSDLGKRFFSESRGYYKVLGLQNPNLAKDEGKGLAVIAIQVEGRTRMNFITVREHNKNDEAPAKRSSRK